MDYGLSGSLESLEDELVLLGRYLVEEEAVLVCELPGFVVLHLPGVLQVAFVADHHDLDVLVGVAVNFVEPPRDVIEGWPVGNVVDE